MRPSTMSLLIDCGLLQAGEISNDEEDSVYVIYSQLGLDAKDAISRITAAIELDPFIACEITDLMGPPRPEEPEMNERDWLKLSSLLFKQELLQSEAEKKQQNSKQRL